MSYTIKTAEAFKLPIASQTRAWDLGAENVIARMAFATSLEMPEAIVCKYQVPANRIYHVVDETVHR